MFNREKKTRYEPVSPSANADQQDTANAEAVELEVGDSQEVPVTSPVEESDTIPTQQEQSTNVIDAPQDDSLTLNIKGTDDQTHQIKISSDASVFDLKSKVADLTNFAVDRQRLIFLGRMLMDGTKLADYKIKDGNFVHLVPKPTGGPNVNPTEDTPTLRNDGRFTLPTDLGLFRDEEPWRRDVYDDIQRLELGLWRARVRLLSSLMLFYYFLEFMTCLSFWMHPEEANNRYVPGHHPSNLYFALDSAENLAGMIVAMWGLKCATEDSIFLSKRFLRGMWELALLHFVNLGIWTQQLATGQVRLQPRMDHPNGQDRIQGELGVSIIFSTMINIMIWSTCLSVASKFHKGLVAVTGEQGTTEERNNTSEQHITEV